MGKSRRKSSDAASPSAPPAAESELLDLFEFSLEMLCIAGGDGYFKRVNPAFERILGYNVEELLARPFLELVHPDDRERSMDELRKLVTGVPCIQFEVRFRCRDGSYRWLSWTAMPQADGQRIYGVASDVTQRKLAEEALRESQQRYRQLIEAITTYTYSVEVHDGVPAATSHSPSCLAATGYTAEEYASDPYLWFKMVHPDDRERVRQRIAGVLLRGEDGPIEHRIIHRDGSLRWIRDTLVLHHDDAGRLVRYDGLVEDITERKLVEERFRSLVESAPDAMVVVNQRGRIVLVNAQAESMFGYSRQELVGRAVEILVPDAFRHRHVEERKAYAAHPRVRHMGKHPELSGLRKDGTVFPAEIALSPIETEQGVLVHAAIRDVTERKRAEQLIRENEVQMLAARRIQARLLPACPPSAPGFDIAGASYAAEFAGGDTFDFLALRDGSLGLVIGDVSGHGVAPALLMSSTHAYLRLLAHSGDSVGEIVSRANTILAQETEDDHFVTLIFGRLEPRTRSFVYASAGHPTGYVLDATGEIKHRLESTGLPLGVLVDAEFATGAPVLLDPGDLLLFVTDGAAEALSPGGEFFGEQRMLDSVRARRQQSSREIIEGLYQDVLQFSTRATPADDVTALVVKVTAQ